MELFTVQGGHSHAVGGTGIVCEDLLQHLIPRKSQICACEALIVPQLLIQKPELFAGCDVVWFIDNESACSSLIRGGSRQDDIATLSALTHLAMLRSGTRIWFEWIDSDSNPSDGLSRDGLTDAWTIAQQWSLSELPPIRWAELLEYFGSSLIDLTLGI